MAAAGYGQPPNPYDPLRRAQAAANPSPAPNTGGVQPPAVPQPTPPAVNTGTPGPAPGTTTTTQFYGSQGGISPGTQSTLEEQLRNIITGAANGANTQGFINRSANMLGQGTEAARATMVNRVNDDAIRRGMFKAGTTADRASAAGGYATGAFAKGLADILNGADQRDLAAREMAATQSANLLGMNRQWDATEQQRIDAEKARAAAAAPKTFQYQDPDTGQVYTMDESWF
jgi:hypothetical protein